MRACQTSERLNNMEDENVKEIELQRSESFGFGFSIIGGAGSELPPVICDIVEDSPADHCAELRAGDVILEVNGVEVNSFTTKEDRKVQAKAERYLSCSPEDIDVLRDVISQQDLTGVDELIVKCAGGSPRSSPKRSKPRPQNDPGSSTSPPTTTTPSMPNRRDQEEARHGTRAHGQGHSHIPRMRNEPSHGHHQHQAKDYQHENGLDPTTTSHNGRNAKSTTDNIPPPKQKGGGFETFVMTGDMIIRTTKKSEPVRKAPSEKLPKKVTGTLKEPSIKSSSDTCKQKSQGSPVRTQQGSPAKSHGSPSKTQTSPSKTHSSPSKLASPSKIPTSPSKSKKPESKIPMPSKSRIPKPASQKESPKHSAKESPKPSRTPLSIPSSDQTTVGASLASPESTDIENLELVNNNVILNIAKNSETIDRDLVESVSPDPDESKEPALAMEERDDLVVVEHWPPPQTQPAVHSLPVTPDYDILTQQPHPLRMESPMSPGEPVFSLELDQPVLGGDTPPMVEQLIEAMSEPPLEACAAGGMYPGELPHSAPVHPQGYMSFAGYRFPDVDLALDIPPDDISSEDDNYKNATDSLVDVDDLPPPPDELLQDFISKPDSQHGTPPLSPYPASAILLREEFSAIGAAQASRSHLDHPIFNGGLKSSYEPTTLETVVETEVTTSGSRDFSHAIPVPGANSQHMGMSVSAEKIQNQGRQGPGVKCAAPMVGVRTSRSQENYFQSTADGMSLVDIDFDESMATSVDALPYGYREKTSTSMDTVSMPGHVPLHDDHSREISRSLDNSPERSYDKYVERIQMPTFISLDEPRAKKSKEGRGRSLDADDDDDGDLVDPHKGVFPQDQYVAPPSVRECVINGHQPRAAKGPSDDELAAFTGNKEPGEEVEGPAQQLEPEEPSNTRTGSEDVSGARNRQTESSTAGEDGLRLAGVTQTSSDTEGGGMGPSIMCSRPSRSRTPSASPSHNGGGRVGVGGGSRGSQPLTETSSAAAHSAASAAAASAASPSSHQQQQSPQRNDKKEAKVPEHEDLTLPRDQEHQVLEAGTEEEDEDEERETREVLREGERKSDGEREGQGELLSEPTLDIEQAEMVAASSSAGPPSPDGGESDSDSIYHQPIKDVDRPSAARLAKRLFHNDGFKRHDISRHLHKKNDFAQLVGEEYLKFFDFAGNTLEQALRKFLKHLTLAGETQERERVLAHFSKRFMECNPSSFKSEDACHTLTCALMLLNTDLHGQNIGRKMTLNEFIENLADLNDGENFPKETLKQLYTAIKTEPLECEIDEDVEKTMLQALAEEGSEDDVEDLEALALVAGRSQVVPPPEPRFIGHNPFLDVPDPGKAVEYKKGYVMRKCCIDSDGRRTPMGRRGWKMFYVVLRDMIMYLHKDEPAMKKSPIYENTSNAIRIHHSLATKASDYTKKQHVLRLHAADGAQYLFQTSDSKECQEWIDTINFVAASLSAAPLPGAVGSQKKFQRPLMPSSYTKLNLREQLLQHEQQIQQREQELHDHQLYPPEKGAKSRVISDYVEKEHFIQFELKRFKTYLFLLQAKLASFPELEPSLVEVAIGEVDEPLPSPQSSHTPRTQQPQQNSTSPPADTDRRKDDRSKPVQRSMSDRYSYRAAIYQKDGELDSDL